MSEERPIRRYGEKQEKQEKEEEKDEKGRHEKNWDEKWRRDPLNAAAWALILVWGGVVLLAANLGVLEKMPGELEGWALFFAGAGVILLLEVLFRLLVPAYRAPIWGALILSVIFLGIGLGELVNWGIIWAIVLIAFGIAVLGRGLLRKKE